MKLWRGMEARRGVRRLRLLGVLLVLGGLVAVSPVAWLGRQGEEGEVEAPQNLAIAGLSPGAEAEAPVTPSPPPLPGPAPAIANGIVPGPGTSSLSAVASESGGFETWYTPANASPGDMVTFHAASGAPGSLQVSYQLSSLISDASQSGGMSVEYPMRSYHEPTVGMYQLSAFRGSRHVLSGLRPIMIPIRSCVVDSSMLSLVAEEVGSYNYPPFATLRIGTGREFVWMRAGCIYYKTDGTRGGGGNEPEHGSEGSWVVPGQDTWPSVEPAAPQGALVFCWASAIDREGVLHFSRPLNFTIPQDIPEPASTTITMVPVVLSIMALLIGKQGGSAGRNA